MPRARAEIDPFALTGVFAADGLRGATSVRLARAARVAKPTLYAHGACKEALFLACVEAEAERLLGLLSDADLRTRGLRPKARLAALAGALVNHAIEHPDAARLLHRTAHHRGSRVAAAVQGTLARLPARLAVLLAADSEPERAEQVALALLAAAAAVGLERPRDPEQAAATLARAFAVALEPAGGLDLGGEREPEGSLTVGLY